jgi:hypothetical protein
VRPPHPHPPAAPAVPLPTPPPLPVEIQAPKNKVQRSPLLPNWHPRLPVSVQCQPVPPSVELLSFSDTLRVLFSMVSVTWPPRICTRQAGGLSNPVSMSSCCKNFLYCKSLEPQCAGWSRPGRTVVKQPEFLLVAPVGCIIRSREPLSAWANVWHRMAVGRAVFSS